MDRQIIKYFPLIIGIFFFYCCSKKEKEKSIETIIENIVQRCDTIDFSKFYNLELLIRERRPFRDVIIINTIAYNSDSLRQWNIDSLPEWNCTILDSGLRLTINNNENDYKKYIADDSIKSLVRSFLELKLDYLKVDYKNNVFLSPPPYSFERAFMMKVNDSIVVEQNKYLKLKDGNGHFTHYKGKWYIADFYIDSDSIKIE